MVITSPDAATLKTRPATAARGDDSDRPDDEPPAGSAPNRPQGPDSPQTPKDGESLAFKDLQPSPGMQVAYYGYRYLDTQLGRWLSRDPIGEEGGVNRYVFIENNGVNLWDFIGLMDCSELSGKERDECCCKKYPHQRRNAAGRAKSVKCCKAGGKFMKVYEAAGDDYWDCVVEAVLESYSLNVAIGVATALASEARANAAAEKAAGKGTGRAAGKAALKGALRGILGGGFIGLGLTVTYYMEKCQRTYCYVNNQKYEL